MAVATGCKPVATGNTTDDNRSVVVQLRLFHFGKEEQPVVVRLCPKRQKNRTGPDFQTLHAGPIAFVVILSLYKNLVTIEIKENVFLLLTLQVAKPRHPTRIQARGAVSSPGVFA